MVIEIYAIPQGELTETTQSGQRPVWKYNNTTGDWEQLASPFHAYEPYTDGAHQIADAEIGLQIEGPIMMGSKALVPGWGDYKRFSDPLPASNYVWSFDEWVHSGGSDSVVGGVYHRLVSTESYGSNPMVFCVEPDTDNAGQYYISGGYDMVAHWDGSSATFDNWYGSGAGSTNHAWSFDARNLSAPYTAPGDMQVAGASPPSTDWVSGISSAYMFNHAGYFWFQPVLKPLYRHIASSPNWVAGVQTLYRIATSGQVPDNTTRVGTGSLRHIFMPMDPSLFTESDTGTMTYISLKPIKRDTLMWLHFRRTMYYGIRNASTGGVVTYPSTDYTWVYALDSSGNLHPALDLTKCPPDVDTVSLGLYMHPESNRLFALYVTSTSIFTQQNASRGTNKKLHIKELVSVDEDTWTFTWKHVGSIVGEAGDMLYTASITSDERHLFIMWTNKSIGFPSFEFYQRVDRFDICTCVWDTWLSEDGSEDFWPPIFMRFGTADYPDPCPGCTTQECFIPMRLFPQIIGQ